MTFTLWEQVIYAIIVALADVLKGRGWVVEIPSRDAIERDRRLRDELRRRGGETGPDRGA